jgi:hypothetical protein
MTPRARAALSQAIFSSCSFENFLHWQHIPSGWLCSAAHWQAWTVYSSEDALEDYPSEDAVDPTTVTVRPFIPRAASKKK